MKTRYKNWLHNRPGYDGAFKIIQSYAKSGDIITFGGGCRPASEPGHSNTGENIMRIIKLSPNDVDFPNRESVDEYFNHTLIGRDPVGKFLITKGRISANGIAAGETIIFSYETEITHIAKASSGRRENKGDYRKIYPYYFVVDVNTITPAHGKLDDVEFSLSELGIIKNIVRTQGWPLVPDTPEVTMIWHSLKM